MRTKILLMIIVLLLWGCEEIKEPLPLEEPVEEVTIEEEEILTPEDIAQDLIGEEGDIISVKRRLDNAIAVLEVLVQDGDEQLVYLLDPEEKKIISVTKKEVSSEEISLKEGHFLARQALEGTTVLRGIKVFDESYIFTFEKQNKAWEVALDKNSQKAKVLGEVPLSELADIINMDLFQAIKKTEVIYGKLDVKEIYYEPWNDSVSYIIIKAQQNIDGEVVSKMFEMDTFSGVISVKND